MSSSGSHNTAIMQCVSQLTRPLSSVPPAPSKLCFIVEQKYLKDSMPVAVADVLTSWGHTVDMLQPHAALADISGLDPVAGEGYDAYVLKTVSSGPGLSILEAAGAAGLVTVNDYRAIRLARDKAVAASRARAFGLPFPKTYFAAASRLLRHLAASEYPLVVKPNNGSGCERIFRIDRASQLEALDLDQDGFLLVQPYLPNPGYDLKLYNTGGDVFAVVRESPLHPGSGTVERLVPVTAELRALALRVGRAFGLDIYGVDVIETPSGWMVLDVNDFPSFGKVPQAAERVAQSIVRIAHRAAARIASADISTAIHGLEATA
jgi:ribosomal protein S6--L-glutamate ligase